MPLKSERLGIGDLPAILLRPHERHTASHEDGQTASCAPTYARHLNWGRR